MKDKNRDEVIQKTQEYEGFEEMGVDLDTKVGGTDWCVTQPFPAGGAVNPQRGLGRRQTHFGKNLLQINLKST